MDPADAYCRLAKVAIGTALSRADLTNWWRAETLARHKHRLTQAQIDDLAAAARDRVAQITGANRTEAA
jgi:hypothetical protein